MKNLIASIILLSSIFGFQNSYAQKISQSPNDAKKLLIGAMTLKSHKNEDYFRLNDSGKAIRSLGYFGIVDKKPNIRLDYTDVYIVNKPVIFAGQKILLIEEEYLTKFIGCCVNPSISIVYKANDQDNEIRAFAAKNKCDVLEDYWYNDIMGDIYKKHKPSSDKYTEIQCKN